MAVLHGVDCSENNGKIAWNETDGQDFSICKISEGLTIQDKELKANLNGSFEQKIRTGGYIYIHPNDPIEGQIENMLNALRGCPQPEFFAVDFEPSFVKANPLVDQWSLFKGPDECFAYVESVFQSMRSATGQDALNYMGEIMAQRFPKGFDLTKRRLWTARYGSAPTRCPGLPDWDIWQYTSRGDACGFIDYADLNIFNGDMVAFNAMLQYLKVGAL